MEQMEKTLAAFDRMSNTKRRRHIFGGVLLSMSLLFCGLTLTIATIKNEYYIEEKAEREKERERYYEQDEPHRYF